MPKKSKKKGGKQSKNAKKLQIIQYYEGLENERLSLTKQLADVITKNKLDEPQIQEIEKQAEEAQQNIIESRKYLTRKLASYDEEVQKVGAQQREVTKELKAHEKQVSQEMAKVEDEYAKIKNNLIKARDAIMSKMKFTNIFRIMHRDLMEACLNSEKTRAGLELENIQAIGSYESQGIVEVSQMKLAADEHLDTFLQTAADCFEKMISRQTQDVIRENILLNREADLAFKGWIKRRSNKPITHLKNSEHGCFQRKRLNRQISKLERILADLNRIRNAEYEKAVERMNESEKDLVVQDPSRSLTEKVKSSGVSTEVIEPKDEECWLNYVMLKELLEDIAAYVGRLKNTKASFTDEELVGFAAEIVKRVEAYDSKEIV